MSGVSIYTLSFKTNHWEAESVLCGVTDRSGLLSPPLYQKEPLSSDQTLTYARSRKTLFRTLLMLTARWHTESGHFVVQRPISYWILTSVRSAPIGRVQSRKSLSGTSLELTGRRHPMSCHFSFSVRSQLDDSS